MSMNFPFGQTVQRDRRPRVPDRYNPTRNVLGEWADADTITIPGAFVASSSSSSLKNATRGEVLTAKSLYCAPDADVQVGDRIRADGVEYYINVLPSADKNPFTGWRPASEIPLDNSLG